MWIFGPLDAPSTSAVTVTELRAEAVERTDSPSMSINGCRLRLVPTALSVLSISRTSPTLTLCWRPPLRTTAYTPDLLSSVSIGSLRQRAYARDPRGRTDTLRACDPGNQSPGAHRGSRLRGPPSPVKRARSPGRPGRRLPTTVSPVLPRIAATAYLT